jgi:chemotaxis signal transduction protein
MIQALHHPGNYPYLIGFLTVPTLSGQFQKLMLLLLFEAGNQRYAIDSRQVVEIVPWVGLYPSPPSHKAIVGLLNYHCQLTTVIDLGRLFQEIPSKPNFGSRIMLLPGNYLHASQSPEYVGLLADRVLETRKISDAMLTPLDSSHHDHTMGTQNLLQIAPLRHALIDQQEIIYYLQPELTQAHPDPILSP